MRPFRPGLLLLVTTFISPLLSAQQSTPTSVGTPASSQQSSQAVSVLQQSLVAMTGGAPIADVTSRGTFGSNPANL